MDIKTAQELLAAASPGPWFLDGFDLHDAGTWVIAVMARAGNPSHKSDPKATAHLAASAPATLAALILAVEALEEDEHQAQGHGHPCQGCEALAAWEAL